MDNNIEPENEENTGETNNSYININNNLGDSNRRITEEPNINEPLETTLSTTSIPQNMTEASEIPLYNNDTASRITSNIFPITYTSDTDINKYQESISRSQLSGSEFFRDAISDNITYSDTTRFGNRSRENRLSAPTPYRPKEYIVSTRPRPNSQIILPTSMQHYGSFAMPNSDQEFRMLARILNWPTQPGQSPVNQISGQVGNPLTKDNMVDDGEIIFDTSSIDQEGDIQQSKGQHPHKSQSTFYIPQERFSVAAAMRQMTKPLQAPEVPPLISANYGKEIFDQIKSDDDPRLIVWSISRAQEIKHGSTLSLSTNSSRRWSFHGQQKKLSKIDNSITSSSSSSGKIIMAATIEKLIEKLTSEIDYTFLTDFFLTYRKFITPIKLCKLLILRFDWALDGDDEKRRLVRVRTFVTIRHWILNYFAYDFIPCRTLRTTLTKYLNKLPSHRLVKNSPRDQRIVQGLKRVIRRLKRIYYRKSAIDYMDKGGDMSSIGSKKLGKKNNQGLNIIIDSGGGVGTSLIEEPTISYNSSNYNTVKEKQLNTIVSLLRHQSSSSSLDSTITPGTTDSESDVIDSYTPNIKETTQNIIYSSSSNSHTSDEDLSSKATHEFYDQKWSKYLPTHSNELRDDNNIYEEDDDGAGVSNKRVPRMSLPERLTIPIDQLKQSERKTDKIKKRSNSMSDLSQRIKDKEQLPPPLPPRSRRHTLDISSSTPPTSPSFFKGGFLKNNFPLKRPKKVTSQEKIGEDSLPGSRKKRSMSFTEAICGIIEDDDDDDDDEFDLCEIDHVGGVSRRNSSPAFIGSGNQKEQNGRRSFSRPSWSRKMSNTVGKFAKGLFISEKNKGNTQSRTSTKCGGIQSDFRSMKFGRLSMLCATSSSSASTEEIDSDLSWGDEINSGMFNEDEFHIHVDGFSYVDESVEEEYYDPSHLDEFETEQQFEHWYDEQQSTQDDINFDSLASSPIDSHMPATYSTLSQDKQSDDDDISIQDLEGRDSRQTSRSNRRRAKVWNNLNLVPVMEVKEDIDQQSSEPGTYFVSQSSSSGSQKDEDPQLTRKHSYLASVSEVDEGGDTDPNMSPQQSFEQEYDYDMDDDESGDHHNIRTLRRFPKVPDLRSVTNIKDIDEKSGKRVSWGTFSSYGLEGSGAAAESVPDSLISHSQSKTAPISKRRGPTQENKNRSQESGAYQRSRQTTSRLHSKKSTEATTSEKGTNSSRGGNFSRSKKPKRTTTHTTTEPSVSQGPTSSFSSTAPSSRQHPYKSFILSYRSEVIAQQFCLIERDLLLQVQWEELVQVSWTNGDKNKSNNSSEIELNDNIRKETKKDKKDVKGKSKESGSETDEENIQTKSTIKDGGVDKVIERFNQTCDWVATEIILTRSLDDRVRVIEKFIRIAQKCLQLSNFATLNQILLGLQSSPVERLRRTWTRVRVTERRILKELNDYISPFGNWGVVRDAMRQVVEDSSAKKRTIKQRRRRGSDVKKANTGCIPFLGLYLSDLVFNAAVPSFINPSTQPQSFLHTSPQFPQQPLVNFQKHRTTATIIKRVISFQSLARGYTFPIDLELYTKCADLKAVEATRLVVMDLDVEDYV